MPKDISSEKVIEDYLRIRIENRKGLCIKLYSSLFTGLPDRMCLLPGGRIFFVELKSTGKKQQARQKYVSKQLQKLGFNVVVIDTLEAVKELPI